MFKSITTYFLDKFITQSVFCEGVLGFLVVLMQLTAALCCAEYSDEVIR